MEEQLEIHTIEINTEVQTIRQFREGITNHHLVPLVQLAVSVDIFITRVTGVYANSACVKSIELIQSLLVGLVNTFILVSPERVQRHTLVGFGAIPPQRRTTVQFGQLIMQEGEVGTDIIMHGTYFVLMSQSDFHTLVEDVTHILNQGIAVSGLGGGIHIQKCVQCRTVEIIDGTGQFAVPETKVDTGIPLLVCFPFTGLVHEGQHCGTAGSVTCILLRTERIAIEDIHGRPHRILESIGVHTVITYLTKAGADLDIIQPIEAQIPHKRFFAQSPSDCGRGEEAPRLLGELR